MKEYTLVIPRHEVKEEFFKTSGPGGQNKNKRDTACRLTHIPTGLQIVADNERTQHLNRQLAWKRLEEKLLQEAKLEAHKVVNNERQQAFGRERSWVWTEWRDTVTNSEGVKASYSKTLKGDFRKILQK